MIITPRFKEKTMKNEPTSTRSDVDERLPCQLKQQEEDRGRERSLESNPYKFSRSGENVEHWRKNIVIVHHQILKIREEDSHIGEEIREGLSKKEKLAVLHFTSQMDRFMLSRPILPSSPLSGKTAIKALH